VAEQESLALGEVRGDVLLVNRGNLEIGDSNENDIGATHRLSGGENLEAMLFGDGDGFAAPVETDGHADPAVFEIQRVGMALGAETNDGHLPFFQGRKVGVRVVIDAGGHGVVLLWGLGWKGSAAGQGDPARPAQFEDSEGFHQGEKLVDLALVAGHLDGEAGGLHVDDFGAEDVANLHHLRAGGGVGLHLEEDQLPVDDIAILEVMDLEHIDQLFELFDHLLENLVVPDDHDGHPRNLVVLGGADVESVDVKAASAKETGDPGEHPEPVLNHDRNGVTHKGRC